MMVREVPALLSEETFAFFAALAADNTQVWFHAHTDIYRTEVDRPWRALVEAVAAPLGALLPELDCAVKTGRVLSRIAARWPRPDQAYRTEILATFRPAADGEPGPHLFIALGAEGLRAGLALPPRTAAWDAVAKALGGAGGPQAVREDGGGGWGAEAEGGALAWWLGRQALRGGEGPVRRGSALRLQRAWPVAVAAGAPGLAGEVLAALRGAVPWYLYAAEAQAVAPAADGALLDALPRTLRAAVAARAEAEGIPVASFSVYALTRAVAP
jgi:hypothetical protein